MPSQSPLGLIDGAKSQIHTSLHYLDLSEGQKEAKTAFAHHNPVHSSYRQKGLVCVHLVKV